MAKRQYWDGGRLTMCLTMYVMCFAADFRERNATVARKWAELTEDERKGWAAKAEAVCTASMLVHIWQIYICTYIRLLYFAWADQRHCLSSIDHTVQSFIQNSCCVYRRLIPLFYGLPGSLIECSKTGFNR